MSDPAARNVALVAEFCNLKNIQGRKVVQLIFEIPIEKAEKACMILGWPDAINPKWCAIALLNEDAK